MKYGSLLNCFVRNIDSAKFMTKNLFQIHKIHCFLNVSFERAMSSSFSNRLKLEKSPYLLQHASNPVNWYPWGDEAFNAATEQNKIIFLSIGYSTCHWCHVMERESFKNEEIAKIMNEHFINIKVDREERPDVDKVYMTFVTAVSESGGWPMSVWLTPDLKPIYGGTYYPPDNRYYGRPGFGKLLTSIAEQWKDNQEAFKESGQKILQVLKKKTSVQVDQSSSVPSDDTFKKALVQLQRVYEPKYGGFNNAPKFPQPSNLNFLFAYQVFYSETELAKSGVEMALHTLQMMAKGGIYDHIAHGFARYSTDQQWHVPHFEKMLYDQAQLVMVYLDAFLITRDRQYADIVKNILNYVMRDLSHPLGGFYSAEDADSLPTVTSTNKREGAFCVWTMQEIQSLLNIPLEEGGEINFSHIFAHHFSVSEDGNVDPYKDPHDELKNKNVLICHGSVEETAQEFEISVEKCSEILEKSRKIIFEARQLRPRPHLDDKMLTAWNGMMLAATARASAVLNDQNYLDRALKNINFIKTTLWKDDQLLRSAYKGDADTVTLGSEIKGYSDDYAWMIRGLVHLYNATLDEQWLQLAEKWQDKQDELFWDSDGGGYFMGPQADHSILLRLKDDQDGAEPSVNSVSSMNLVLLSRLLHRSDYGEKAQLIFKAFSDRLEKIPVALPEMATALLLHLNPTEQIILSGDGESEMVKKMLLVVHSSGLNPNRTLLLADSNHSSFLYSRHDDLNHYVPKPGENLAYVCQNFACKLPSKTPQDLRKCLDPKFSQ